MAVLDFPDAPTVGQIYDKWSWNGSAWVLPPAPPAGGARQPVKNTTATTFTPTLIDENVLVTLSNAAAITVTLPSDATIPFVIGAEVSFLWLGTGQPSFAAGGGATATGTPGMKLRARYSAATAKKIAANTWVVVGDLAS